MSFLFFYFLDLVNCNNPGTNMNNTFIKCINIVFYIVKCEHACFSQIVQPLKDALCLKNIFYFKCKKLFLFSMQIHFPSKSPQWLKNDSFFPNMAIQVIWWKFPKYTACYIKTKYCNLSFFQYLTALVCSIWMDLDLTMLTVLVTVGLLASCQHIKPLTEESLNVSITKQ